MDRLPVASSIFTLLILLLTVGQGHAQEVMLGVHGGSGLDDGQPPENSVGAVSIIDQENADVTVLATPSPSAGITGVATNSEGRIFASTGSAQSVGNGPRLIEIDPATGELLGDLGRLMTSEGYDCFVGDLSFQPGTDTLFGLLGTNGPTPRCGVDNPGGTLVTINTQTAEVTVVGKDESIPNANGGIAFASDGTLYFTPCWSLDSVLLTLDPDTAELLTETDLPFGTCFMGLAVRPSDGTLFGSLDWENRNSNGKIISTINPANGQVTLIGDTSPEVIHDLTFTNAIELTFRINAGLNDAWFFRGTAGQGFLIIVFPDRKEVFVAWFTYDAERPMSGARIVGGLGHLWMTAQGPYQGDTAMLDIFLTEGGVLDMEDPAPSGRKIGTMTIVWKNCNNAVLTYQIDDPPLMGEIPLERITLDNVALCRQLE